jgi:Cu(I)/Ag(I) efflux system membrane fusion protein
MEMDGKVDFIEPIFQADDRSTSIRVYLNNHEHGMKVGSLVRGEVIAGSKHGQWLPRTAVVSLGRTRLVWLKKGAAFRVRAVKTGIQTAEQIQIISGLNKQDSVAVNAQYLSDSDSFIKVQGHE